MTGLLLAPNLSLPIDIASQTVALFGIRGSGKTNTAGVLVEELLSRHYPVAVIDPTDAWWGLRAGRDGSSSGGFPVFIFGGPHGDIPLQETDGKVIAEFLVAEQVPVILSLRHLRKGAQRRFVTEFCEELYHLKGRDSNRTPLTVVIDEAPLFVPQKVLGEVARTVGAVEDLIARGRNSGFGVVLISQRSATLNADVRTQADTIICHRVTSPLDRKAISDWFEENATTEDLKTILQSLATLKNGEAWAWAPTLQIMSRVHMRLRRTFDSSATPKIGETIRPPKKLTDIDLEKLKGQLATTIEKVKADDPKELRRRIQQLEAELKKANTFLSTQKPEVKPVEVPVITAEDRQFLTDLRAALELSMIGANKRQAELVAALQGLADRVAMAFARKPQVERSFVPPPKPTKLAVVRSSVASSAGTLTAPERRILTVLAQRPDGVEIDSLATLAGYTVNGHFNNQLGGLRSKDLITPARVTPIQITNAGMSELGEFEPLPTGEELQRYWLDRLSSPEARILQVLLDRYPESIEIEELAAEAGYTVNGHFNNQIGSLRTKGLMSPARMPILAAKEFFE